MNLVVDTSAWSLLLRRRQPEAQDSVVRELRAHLDAGDCIHLVGCILQELLDGVKSPDQFKLLHEYLEPFPLIALERADYLEAARLKNHCRSKGVQAAGVDFLIAAACFRRNYPLLTADQDFRHIARHCELTLVGVMGRGEEKIGSNYSSQPLVSIRSNRWPSGSSCFTEMWSVVCD